MVATGMIPLAEQAEIAVPRFYGFSLTRCIAAFVGTLGLFVLAGWHLDIPVMKSIWAGGVQMKANTALALIFASASLAILEGQPSLRAQRAAQLLAVLPAAIGAATLCEYVLGWQFGLDEMFFDDIASAFNPVPGRMAPFSAVAVMSIGATLAALPFATLRPLALAGGAVPASIGAVSLLGYLWKASEFTNDQWLPPVSFHSALAFLLLGIGIMLADLATPLNLSGALRKDRTSGFVEAKVLGGFIVSVMLLCLGGGITYRMGVDFAHSAQLVINSQEVRAALGRLYASISSAESAQRNYLLMDIPEYRQDYMRFAAQVQTDIGTLRHLIDADPVQLAQLEALVPMIRERMNRLSSHIDLFERRGEVAARAAIAAHDGVRPMASIRAQIGQMDGMEENVLKARAGALAKHRSYSLMALQTTVAIATVVLILLFASIVRDIRERACITKALEEAQRAARRATHAKSDFLAAMSHEIRTPMNGVIGMLDVLQESSLMCAQVEMVRLIRESADGLLRIIDDVLDFSKIEAGRLEIERLPISVADVVEKTGGLLNRVAERKGGTLTVFVDPAIPAAVLGDTVRLQQVLINLTNNAIKFSSGLGRPGRVSVRAVLVESDAAEAVVEFRVADNGIGMDEKTLTRVFTSFTQADASTTRRYGGTGLGLSISKQLVGLMNGTISVATEAGKGATFTVRLPFAVTTQSAPAVTSPVSIAGLSCLVIGGQTGLTNDLIAYLESEGAVVNGAADLSGACAWTRAQPAGLTVWVVDNDESACTLADALGAREGCDANAGERVVLVVVSRGRRRVPRAEADGVVVIDGNALYRRTLSRAVAIAAGLASDKTELPARPHRTLKRSPPTRVEAMREKSLILLAEDNDMNQNVIRQQLHLLGYAVDVARHGREALLCWQTGDYALVFTDLHMPEMDGYDLAMAIRVAERGRSRIPIIALTANALSGEAERCRDAGMDDYLSKPASLIELGAALGRWLPATTLAREAAAAPAPVDTAVLEALVGSDPEVVAEFLQHFTVTAAHLAAELREACATDRGEDAASSAHKLKSCARSVGALALGEVCAAMEVAGSGSDATELNALLPRFEAEMAAVEQHLGASRVRDALEQCA